MGAEEVPLLLHVLLDLYKNISVEMNRILHNVEHQPEFLEASQFRDGILFEILICVN
jgi:hypothetical protein